MQRITFKKNPSRLPTKIQSLVFDRAVFNETSARSWARNHGFDQLDVDLKTNTLRLRQRRPSSFAQLRTVQLAPGVKAVIGVQELARANPASTEQCPSCNGSGEGRVEGAKCRTCGGRGELRVVDDEEDDRREAMREDADDAARDARDNPDLARRANVDPSAWWDKFLASTRAHAGYMAQERSREERLALLQWNDRNGCYLDSDPENREHPVTSVEATELLMNTWLGEQPPQQNPGGIEQVILDASARAAFVTEWANAEDEAGRHHGGEELMDIAPATSTAADAWAKKLWEGILQANPELAAMRSASVSVVIERLWEHTAKVAGLEGTQEEAREFGHYVAMQAMGHGVSWGDDHPPLDFKVPHKEAYDLLDARDNPGGDVPGGSGEPMTRENKPAGWFRLGRTLAPGLQHGAPAHLKTWQAKGGILVEAVVEVATGETRIVDHPTHDIVMPGTEAPSWREAMAKSESRTNPRAPEAYGPSGPGGPYGGAGTRLRVGRPLSTTLSAVVGAEDSMPGAVTVGDVDVRLVKRRQLSAFKRDKLSRGDDNDILVEVSSPSWEQIGEIEGDGTIRWPDHKKLSKQVQIAVVELLKAPWSVQNTTCAVHEERDNLNVRLLDARGQAIIDVVDNEARDLLSEGFIDARNLHVSLCAYANKIGAQVR